jgi:uncharacterized damage-inducible protein DinB
VKTKLTYYSDWEAATMSASELLLKMFRYQAWANGELLEAMNILSAERHPAERRFAIRLMNHCLVVSRIFAAHLLGKGHRFAADNTPGTPELAELRAGLAAIDRWYLDYVWMVSPAMLTESIPFVFTDGSDGYMTREEMLTHVVTHCGYHRGEVGRVMAQASGKPDESVSAPWDTYALHLHATEPARRLRGRTPLPEAHSGQEQANAASRMCHAAALLLWDV